MFAQWCSGYAAYGYFHFEDLGLDYRGGGWTVAGSGMVGGDRTK
jgi:hypothetical protein